MFEQIDKQFTRQHPFIGSDPEHPFDIDRRGSAEALALPRPRNHCCLATHRPGLARRIGTKPGFVPEVDFRAIGLGLSGNGGISLALPVFDSLQIALIGALQQRLLWRQPQPGKQAADRDDAQAYFEFTENQLTYRLPPLEQRP